MQDEGTPVPPGCVGAAGHPAGGQRFVPSALCHARSRGGSAICVLGLVGCGRFPRPWLTE